MNTIYKKHNKDWYITACISNPVWIRRYGASDPYYNIGRYVNKSYQCYGTALTYQHAVILLEEAKNEHQL